MHVNNDVFRPNLIALLVSQAIYRMQVEAARDRELINRYSK